MADTATTEEFIVGEDAGACFYTRYPNGISKGDDAYDLCCPACGDDHLKVIGEWYPARHMMMGDKMRCWTCKHEFYVTENCWKWRKISKG